METPLEQEIPPTKDQVEVIKEAVEVRPEAHKPRTDSMYPVTDKMFYMNGFLRDNLNEVPKFLKKTWDCVVIVSGSAKVRIGKSTLAMQGAYYIAWLLNELRKRKKLVPEDTPVPFDNTHVAFDPEQLMKIAEKLPKNSVIVYDEGRAGLDSARAMENINKATQDFFQECGQYGHVIFIVLPDFFKLNETIAIPRSLFLLNCYVDKHYNRGYFSFYNEHKKELLYVFGKKKFGSTSKYLAVDDNFRGKFSDYFPLNKKIYDENKRRALRRKRQTSLEKRWHWERDVSWFMLHNRFDLTAEEITKSLNSYPDIKLSARTMTDVLGRVRSKLKKVGYDFGDDETEGNEG